MMLICCVPSVTPVMPPPKPKITSDRKKPENPGLLHGAFASQPKSPRLKPFLRIATSIEAGTVKPWIIDASTARYIA